jgi:hypothetical protein
MSLHPDTFSYLQPTDEQIATMYNARKAAAEYAEQLQLLVPEGPDKTFIFRELRTLATWVNIAITRNPDGSPRT